MLVALSTVSVSSAQSGATEPAPVTEANRVSQTSFPGSAWVNSGYVSPLESGNLLTTYAFEQGITLVKRGPHSVMPYSALTIAQDVEGLDWNNKAVSQIGLKYSRAFRNGVLQAGAGYAYERRFHSDVGMGQPIGFASYWFGWNPDRRTASSRTKWSSFPGTSWAAVGNYAPAEGNNLIASIYVQQGVTLARFSGFAIIPIVEHTLTIDSAGHPWNNRRIFGEGLKVRLPVGTGVLETSAIYKHERRWRNGNGADGLTASVNLWYGWNPSKTHKEK
jgi:hypothetical protein